MDHENQKSKAIARDGAFFIVLILFIPLVVFSFFFGALSVLWHTLRQVLQWLSDSEAFREAIERGKRYGKVGSAH